jgi:hypothetical protein
MIAKPRLQKQKLVEAAKYAISLAISGHEDVLSITSPADWDEGTYFEVRIKRTSTADDAVRRRERLKRLKGTKEGNEL